MATGRIKIWNDERGTGWIENDAGGENVFLHHSEVSSVDRNRLANGTLVEFDIQNSEYAPGRLDACNFRLSQPLDQKNPNISIAKEVVEPQPATHFHNPYTFVPTPPRPLDRMHPGEFAGDFNPLEHDPPLDHASLKPDLWTGHIPIKLTTVTPLVLLKDDGRERKPSEPQEYDVHSRIPEPSLRGMLRSAYEVVTNSRYSSFRNDDRLAYRMETDSAKVLIPAIIENGKVVLYPGTSKVTAEGPDDALYAAMLTLYKRDHDKKDLKTLCHKNYKPKTGDEVWAEILLCQHRVSNRGSDRYKDDFKFYKVIKIWNKSDVPNKPKKTKKSIYPRSIPKTHGGNRRSYYVPVEPEERKMVKGYVMITNQNMGNKHDERIFFNPISDEFKVTKPLEEAWRMRIQSYRNAHSESEIFYRNRAQKEPWKYIDNQPGKTAWSPHQYQDSRHRDIWKNDPHRRSTTHDALDLKDGTMAYARCKIEKGKITGIKDLFPVMISRELYEKSPKDLLDKSLQPAERLSKLSPADRLFGWTPQGQGSDGGYKSRIRVVCEDGECPKKLKSFEDDPLPLSILGQPKPEQGRFYVAVDDKGTPQEGIRKQDAGYDIKEKKQLRGRKHYWHHKGFENDTQKGQNHWDHSNNQDQEYIRKGKTKDTQNRSIKGWIKPKKKFKASLYVQNLQPEEIGALLWLLSLPDKHYFKLGYGKPLGFGSVKIEIDTDRLENGCLSLANHDNWKKYYATLDDTPPAKLDKDKQNEFIDQFTKSILKAYQQPKQEKSKTENVEQNSIPNRSWFDQLNSLPIDSTEEEEFNRLPFIQGFLKVLQGPDDQYPIHYPRKDPVRYPDGKNFEWFVENERGDRDRNGKQLGLPDVNADDQKLPYSPSDPKPKRR